MLYNIIVVVITIICALLTLVILLQNGQGSGLSGIAGGGGLGGDSGGLGARRTADLLSKSTSILGGVFLVLCILANFAIDRQTAPTNSVLQEGAPIEDFSAPSQTQSAVPTQTPPPPVNSDGNSGGDSGEEN